MRRTLPGLITLALCFSLVGLALAQEGNPLDRPRPRVEGADDWTGAFVDESEQLILVLSAEGERVEGMLVDQADGADYEVEGKVQGEVIEGVVRGGGQDHSFSARRDGDAVVIISGRTTSRWRRAPGSRRAAAGLAELRGARRQGNEAAAIGALKTLNTAQVLFREGDKENDGTLDYATLEELASAQLIDQILGSGTKQGYRFAVRVSPEHPEFLWMATATPVEPGKTGTRHFVTNHAGVIYYSTRAPFALDDSCEIPPGATPVGRPEPAAGETTERQAAGGAAKGPGLAHVKVGQRYRYRLQTPGGPPLEMTYTVTAVGSGVVKYEITTHMDMGQGMAPVGPPTPQEWRHEPIHGGQAPGAPGVGQEREREMVTISGVTFDCMVLRTGEHVSFVPCEGELPTFPGIIKATNEGTVLMELIGVE